MNKLSGVVARAGLTCLGMAVFSLQLKCQEEKEHISGIKGLKFQTLLPVEVRNGEVASYNKTIYLYEAGDYGAIQYPVHKQRSKITVNKKGDIISDELMEFSTLYRYVFYHPGDSTGLHYDSTDDTVPVEIPVDSLLRSHGVFNSEKIFRRIQDSLVLVSTGWDSSQTILTEKYIPLPETKLRISDSIILVYSKRLNRYRFSLPGSRGYSSGTKLSQLKLILNANRDSNHEIERYSREMIFELTESFTYLPDIEKLLKDFCSRQLLTQ